MLHLCMNLRQELRCGICNQTIDPDEQFPNHVLRTLGDISRESAFYTLEFCPVCRMPVVPSTWLAKRAFNYFKRQRKESANNQQQL